ncbi:hypothetical protein ABLG96_08790 [Nakamurella sp. A5-74]|uniref:Uncharacterized protein n=1 Tax=Nakamurella sp. A5-74 TaxID=3158264 RepID=A0AAU8DVF5_9ACTN
MENRPPKFGQNDGAYATTPPGHTGVCWAAALGEASRGQHTHDPADAIARRALAMLADGTAECICSRRRTGRRRNH